MGIKDHCIKDWYCANKATVNALTFDTFISQLHMQLLKDGWRNTLQSEILSMTQGKKPFNDWQNSLGAQNTLLVNSASHILEQQLQNHLNANMNTETKLECIKNKVHDEVTFATWIKKLSALTCNASEVSRNTHASLRTWSNAPGRSSWALLPMQTSRTQLHQLSVPLHNPHLSSPSYSTPNKPC